MRWGVLGGRVEVGGRLDAAGLQAATGSAAATAVRSAAELHRAVLDGAEFQAKDVERVVLVEPPRRLRALLRELVDRAQHVARGEVDERARPIEWSVSSGHALVVSVLVHVVEQPAHVLAGEVALERPRRVRVAERDRQVRHAAEHHALVAHRRETVDLAAVDRDLASRRAPSRFRPVAVTMRSASSSSPDSSACPVSVNVSMRSVTTDARPSLIASNRSPSGTRQRRWSHGL